MIFLWFLKKSRAFDGLAKAGFRTEINIVYTDGYTNLFGNKHEQMTLLIDGSYFSSSVIKQYKKT